MKKINSIEDFLNQINNNNIIANTIFDFSQLTISDLIENLTFVNCVFKMKFFHLYNIQGQDISITFKKCSFEGELKVSASTFYSLSLENIYSMERLYIYGDNNFTIHNFKFKNEFEKSENPLDTRIEIQNYIFKSFDFFNVNHTGKHFKFIGNSIGLENQNNSFERQSIGSSWISNAIFLNNHFIENISFFRTIFVQNKNNWDLHYHGTSFENNIFLGVDFENTSFSKDCQFVDCTFDGRINFYNANNWLKGSLSFKKCSFNDHADFEGAHVNELSFNLCLFDKTVSFASTEVEKIQLTRNIFNKAAFFDGLRIENIEKCDRTTLRTIKQELQKTDNRIDYNKFRSYELQEYYSELKTNGTSFWNKDRLILYATKHATGFDHSWQKALGFVLSAAFIFFSLFFISENYALPFSWSGIPQYITGYFRFLLVTDFYNPLITNGREYISNDGWNHIASWFIFILGKIVIAFGIYEMIQAFRKFKA